MLRVKVFLFGFAAVLGAAIWWLWSAAVSEPPMAAADIQKAAIDVPELRSEPAARGASGAPARAAAPTRAAVLPPAAGVPWSDLTHRVRTAIADGSPQNALVAANLIERCAAADRRVDELFALRDAQVAKPAFFTAMLSAFGLDDSGLIEQAQREQRNCQGLDAQTRALQPALLQRAFDAGVEGAAVSYGSWLEDNHRLGENAALLASLRARVRSDADAGDIGSVLSLAWNGDSERHALEPQAQQAYRLALKRIQAAELDDAANSWIAKPVKLMLEFVDNDLPPLTLSPAQMQAAEQQAQRIFDTYKRRPPARKGGVG